MTEQTAEPKVLIRGNVFLYRTKAPFVQSGESIRGALEYDDVADKVRCHECGGWFAHLGSHLVGCSGTIRPDGSSGITAREYKLKHGLQFTTALVSERVRGNLIAVGLKKESAGKGISSQTARNLVAGKTPRRIRYEMRNINGTCAAQLIDKIKTMAAALGHTPSCDEMRASGIHHRSALRVLGCKTLRDMQALCGLVPNKTGGHAGTAPNPGIFADTYTRPLLRELLINFYVAHHRRPTHSDFKRKALPSLNSYRRHFGSMANALMAAGLVNAGIRLTADSPRARQGKLIAHQS